MVWSGSTRAPSATSSVPADSSVSGTTSSASTGAPSALVSGLSASSHGEGGSESGSTRILLWSASSAMTRASCALGPTSTGILSLPCASARRGPNRAPATSTVTRAPASVSMDSSVRPAQGSPRTVMSESAGASPLQKAKRTRVGGAGVGGGRPEEAGEVLARAFGGEGAHRDRAVQAGRGIPNGDLRPGARPEHQPGGLGLHDRRGPRGDGDGEAQERGEESGAHVASARQASSVCSALSVPPPRRAPRGVAEVGRRRGGRLRCPGPAPVCAPSS